MDHPDFIVCSFMENSIGLKRVDRIPLFMFQIIDDPSGNSFVENPYPLHQVIMFQGLHRLNPFKPNGSSHYNQLDKSIAILKGCWVVFFIFIQVLTEHSLSKQWRP